MEKDDKGKVVPVKVGMEPVQRDGLEYEFDLVGDLNHQHDYVISKSTLDTIHPRDVIRAPDEAFGRAILEDITGSGAYPTKPRPEKEELTPQQERARLLYNEVLALRHTLTEKQAQTELSKLMRPVQAIGKGDDVAPGYAAHAVDQLQEAVNKHQQQDGPRRTLEPFHADLDAQREMAQGERV